MEEGASEGREGEEYEKEGICEGNRTRKRNGREEVGKTEGEKERG